MNLKKILSLLTLCFCLGTQAQEVNELTDFNDETIPASPTVAELGSYAYVPVGYSTGTQNISVPIWTTQGHDLSMPISMSYRPGVRTAESSPYTGHGWSLFAGGVITRNVNDKADPWPRRNDLNQNLSYAEIATIAGGAYDGAPDVFNYNFNGYTGQFALKNDLESLYYLDEQRNWKFFWNATDIIEIITEDGTKYIFAETETTTFEGDSGGSANDVITSWFLTSVISAKNNEEIELTYIPDNPSMPRRANNTLEINPFTKTQNFIDESPGNYAFATKKLSSIKHYINNVVVNTITFESNTLREDTLPLAGASYALSRISIFNGDQTGQRIKYFDFDIRNIQGERLFLYEIQEFSGDGTALKPPYEFTYINEEQLPNRTEYKSDYWGYYSSNGTQFPYIEGLRWRSALTKEPTIEATYGSLQTMKFPTGAQTSFSYESNEYHEQDWDYETHELSLKWDNGSNQWETSNGNASTLETHSFSTPVDQYVKVHFCIEIRNEDGGNINQLIGQLNNAEIYIRNTANNNLFQVRFDAEGDGDLIDMLVYSNQQKVISPRSNACYGKIPNHPTLNCGSPVNAGFVVPYGQSTNSANAYSTYTFNGNSIGECLDRDLFIQLPAGSYVAGVKTSGASAQLSNASNLKLEITHHSGNLINHKIKGGGIRVKTQYLTGEDFEEETRSYYYEVHDTNGNSLGKSSGTITDRPLPALYIERFDNGPFPWSFNEFYVLNSNAKHIANSNVYYTEVKVTDGEEDENGFEIRKFYGVDAINNYNVTFSTEWNPQSGNFGVGYEYRLRFPYWERYPYPLVLIENGLWGKPQSTTYFKNENNARTLISEEIFEYDVISKPLLYYAYADLNVSPTGSASAILAKSHLTFKHSQLKSTETILYDQQGLNPVATKTTYGYKPGYFMPNKITTVDSKGDTRIKKIKYAYEYENADFSGTSITTDDLFDANILVPIEEQLWKLEAGVPKLLGGRLNIYDKVSTNTNSNALYKPVEILSLEKSSLTDQTKITNQYNEVYYGDNLDWSFEVSGYDYGNTGINLVYDQHGNLLQTTPKDGPTVSYIWGYHQQYPVAKIENATRSEIEALSGFGANFHSGANGLSTAQENTLRTSLPNAMITTYTYEPLVGVTSMTDPRGYTMTYHYDEFNRLEFVKDQDGHLVSENQYNYKN